MLYEVQILRAEKGTIRRESPGPVVSVHVAEAAGRGRFVEVMDQGPASPKRSVIACPEGPLEIEICFARARR